MVREGLLLLLLVLVDTTELQPAKASFVNSRARTSAAGVGTVWDGHAGLGRGGLQDSCQVGGSLFAFWRQAGVEPCY